MLRGKKLGIILLLIIFLAFLEGCLTNANQQIESSAKYIYAAGYSKGIFVLDVTDPVNPKKVGCLDTKGSAIGIYISGEYAYVADYENGLVIVDISEPTNPKKVGHLYIDGSAIGVYISGEYAYVADKYNGLMIVNISDPANPILAADMMLFSVWDISMQK
ncbi:hypothetical protein BG95_03030 [Thermosipho sp. 1063]|uniref:LVIVD repeat-containing protein n=1 Tax=Thermosipho sp. 1063 TaxID=1462747 RepID=UPI000950B3C0|nr:hypothetical protein [Thermosipho sp. 1063]APT73009.1 hypothetical protein BG95_03030 [Thermosipho sp. 1063]